MREEIASVRAVTAKIAAGYDLVPYNPQGIGSPGLDPVYVFGLAALYRDCPVSADFEVLDLGCGGGSQILRAGAQGTGRLVGVDISRAACDEAIARCASLGPRCRILCTDLFDLDEAIIGQFDLIYLVGTFYVVPPAVQRRLLEVLSACLKPGGVALISYYSPDIWRHFDALRQRIQSVSDRCALPAARVEAARDVVRRIAETPGRGGISDQVLGHALSCEEPTFFHEMLGEILAPVTAAGLESALTPSGIHFLNWMMPGPFAHIPDAGARAAAADRMPGGYHYAVFAKYDAGVAPAWTGVCWQTRLRRAGAGFRDAATGHGLAIDNSATALALDVLAGGPRVWAAIEETLAAQPAGTAQIAGVRRDFLSLWQNGLLTSASALSP